MLVFDGKLRFLFSFWILFGRCVYPIAFKRYYRIEKFCEVSFWLAEKVSIF